MADAGQSALLHWDLDAATDGIRPRLREGSMIYLALLFLLIIVVGLTVAALHFIFDGD